VNPQAESVKFGASDSVVADEPAGRWEGDNDTDESDRENRHAAIACQRSPFHILPKNEVVHVMSSLNSNKVAETKSSTADWTARVAKILSNFSNQQVRGIHFNFSPEFSEGWKF
jgi:hypothetical protein